MSRSVKEKDPGIWRLRLQFCTRHSHSRFLPRTVFGCYYAVNGVLKERAVELYAFLLASLILTAYVIYEV